MKPATIFLSACMAAVLASCSFLHNDTVASAAGQKLHKKDVVSQIPSGLSSQDSAAMADAIIRSWAVARIVEQKTALELSDVEKDVEMEIEEYRNALLRYRFEHRYVENHLDTVVTAQQIAGHYEANKATYALSAPIVKVRIFRLPPKSRERDLICKLLAAGGDDEVAELQELGHRPACSYRDFGGNWISVVDLARDYDMDYGSFLAKKDKDSFVIVADEQSEENIIYIAEQVGFGKVPPVEYCENEIKEVIISRRRYELSKNLERDLLEEASKNGEFEIYEITEQ